jgi:general secretion pathway protein K
MKKNTGVALVIVIWVLSLLTLMAASFALTIRRELAVTMAVRDNAIVEALAESGIHVAQTMLLKTDTVEKWWPDGSLYQFKLEGARIRVKVLAENGKINLNRVDEALLMKVMALTELDVNAQNAMVSAILDWRDADQLVRVNGAEKEQYQQAGLSYGPSNQAFMSLEELQRVLGMNEQLYRQLEPLFSVHNTSASVDWQTADKTVLKVLTGLDEQTIMDFLNQRIRHHRQGLPPPSLPIGNPSPSVTGSSNNQTYQVISQVKTDNGLYATFAALVQKTQMQDKPFRWLKWQALYDYPSFFTPEQDAIVIESCCLEAGAS